MIFERCAKCERYYYNKECLNKREKERNLVSFS